MNIFTERRDVVIGVVLALVVGLLIGFGWGRQTAGGADMAAASAQTASTSTGQKIVGGDLIGSSGKTPVEGTVAQGDSVSVASQPAGMSVALTSVTLTQEGWVAIRDSSGTTLGAALFAPGTHAGVSVALLKPTIAGGNYQALMYFDDGTKMFNLKTETIVLNPDGSVAGATFYAQ